MSENIFAPFFGAVQDGAREREAREYGRDGPHGRWDPREMPWIPRQRMHPDLVQRLLQGGGKETNQPTVG